MTSARDGPFTAMGKSVTDEVCGYRSMSVNCWPSWATSKKVCRFLVGSEKQQVILGNG